MRTLRLFVASLVLASNLPGQEVARDSTALRPSPAFGWPEVKGFALTAALGGVASLADQSARDAVRGSGPQNNKTLDAVARHGNLFGQPVALSLGWVMYGGGLLAKQPVIATTGFRAIEAITVSGVVTWTLKGLFGRARPAISPTDPGDFQFTRGFRITGDYESMPSGHATAAFAFATAVTQEVALRAPRHATWVGLVSYGSALTTAYARMHDDRHWLSDVTVGAGIGTVTALAIHRWHRTRPNDPIDAFFLKPVLTPLRDGSTAIGFSVVFR